MEYNVVFSFLFFFPMANEDVSFTHNQILGNETITFNLPDLGTELNPCYSFDRNHNQSCIASVICPGVQKCGTTFLYFSLINHPRIAASRGKELNYYLNTSYDGIVHYSDYFIHDSDKILIDFSPKYMMVPESAELIYKTNRNAKFIITLRDPVDRAYSHFRFQQKLYSNDRHIESLLNGPCPRRIEDITFKHYLQEEYHVLTKCSMIDLIHKDVSILFR